MEACHLLSDETTSSFTIVTHRYTIIGVLGVLLGSWGYYWGPGGIIGVLGGTRLNFGRDAQS